MDLTIIWWHGIKGDFMYYFVDEANVAPYRSYCSKVLEELRDNLNSKRDINSIKGRQDDRQISDRIIQEQRCLRKAVQRR